MDYETYFTTTGDLLDNNIPQLLLSFNEVLGKGFDGHHFISGLASHFRDLLVCKNQETITLLEVGAQTKQKYLEQSQKAPASFLLKGIELANDCDLKYKASRNQRLLVELCLMQLASITNTSVGEKKNDQPHIIPAAHFQNNKTTLRESTKTEEKIINEPVLEVAEEKVIDNAPATATYNVISNTLKSNTPVAKEGTTPTASESRMATLHLNRSKTSGLSLSSIRKKKEHEKNKIQEIVDPKNLPEDPFTEKDLRNVWLEFGKIQDRKGQMIIGSMFAMNIPSVKDHSIVIELPNHSMKEDLEQIQNTFLQYSYKKLNNYKIELQIIVNEEVSKKYAFTPQDKYEKLKEKNPLIDKLRSEFDLDI